MSLMDSLHYYLVENIDQRVASWPLMKSPYTVPLILLAHLYIIAYLGPRYMKNRKPYSLKRFIRFYDIFQIVANSIIVYMYIDGGWYQDIWIYCTPQIYRTDPKSIKIASAMWWTVMLKMFDLIETAIYVLRKKERQISFLHLYHHVSTVFITWFDTRYVALGMACFPLLVNCTIHIIMYTYYFLSSFGPSVQKMIQPYKPILTITQMVQFVGLMLHSAQTLLPNCPVTKIPGTTMIINLMINFYLFYDFYKKTYTTQKAKGK